MNLCLYGLDNFYYRRFLSTWIAIPTCLYGVDNFYYRRQEVSPSAKRVRLYGLDNFYYRRLARHRPESFNVYTDLIISTIVDSIAFIRKMWSLYGLDNFYYRRFEQCFERGWISLYGLDNFYYRRSQWPYAARPLVYTDLIISTIVDKSIE